MDKSKLRKEMREVREGISNKEKKDIEIFSRLFQLEEFKHCKNIFIYLGYGSEINTMEFLKGIWKIGKNIVIPYTNIQGKTMVAMELKEGDPLKKNIYGILEHESSKEYFKSEDIDLVIVPGLAFTREGGRLGYGGGYYDKYLSTLKGVPLVALCYTCQLREELPIEKHDIKVDIIITEYTTINCLK